MDEAYNAGSDSYAAEFTKALKLKVRGLGADLVGVADIEDLKKMNTSPKNLLAKFKSAISIATEIPKEIIEAVKERPTAEYSRACFDANSKLDKISFEIAKILRLDKFESFIIPASEVADWRKYMGAVSHKAVGRMAGLGWQGKSLLLISPLYGPRIRLSTVLTTAMLKKDLPLKNLCGECRCCMDACPGHAIKGVRTESHYSSRLKAVDIGKCIKTMIEMFASLDGVDAYKCGICIRACPVGK
jgi:epoxyqueuosine reductase QueG